MNMKFVSQKSLISRKTYCTYDNCCLKYIRSEYKKIFILFLLNKSICMFLKFANIQSISASTMTYGAIKSSKEQSGNVVHSISYFFIKHLGIIKV